ncbi:MAG: hypothetical protein A2X61_06230 [Ignavibacteria bacterium GWB2_35_12]|nr:MAG: hypothetical protein A2X61_06230 [Ignavibacteria bacterium GWB2_35_12]OGU93173.1 MAG: hypothetical protein A2220_11210 [Ignavibacteria bacterium RIFOXYA2_FULL_35_10]OGV19982.1 MAG: hypothetical protein A2475_00210 [Ignavibacteria bacterium RIFOXYC2_FULL_35_21]
MKKEFMKWLLLSIVLCAFLSDATAAQPTAVINYIEAGGYPNIKAYYTYEDASGNQVRPPNYSWMPQDIIINENGKVRNHNPGSPFCPNPIDKTFSAILVFDVSNTMQKGMDGSGNPPPGAARWELAVEAMKDFITALNPNLTECAVIQFSSNAKILHRFTNNKDSLFQSLTPGNITLGMGTNYNAAFIIDRYRDSTSTALYMAKSAKYKPVIIFLTDGNHETKWGSFANPPYGDGRFFIGDVINLAKERNVRVFCIKIGNDTLSGINLSYMNGLAGIEGKSSDNLEMDVTDRDRLSGYYDKVLQICGQVGYPAPCWVEWKSDCFSGVRDLQLNFPNHGNLTASTTFTVPDNIQPDLEISPNPVTFSNVDYTTYKDEQVKITARRNFVEIWGPAGFNSSDARYKVQDWGTAPPPPFPYILPKDSSRFITVRYDPTDSSYSSATIDLNSSACFGDIINLSGMMDLFCKDVNMGDCTVSDSVSATVTQLFCNRGPTPINITGLDINTRDYKMFEIVSVVPPIPCTLDTGQCLQVTFKFKPTSSGGKAARISLLTESGNYTANIIGNGIGQPGITANPMMFENTDCKIPTREDTVFLRNTGPLPLTIDVANSILVGKDSTEFVIIQPPGIPTIISASSDAPVIIRFEPKSWGAKECSLRVISNAGNEPTYYVRITGFADSVNFAPPDTTIDLGVVCLGDTVVTDIPLRNVGTKDLHIDATTIPSSFRLQVSSWDLNGNTNTIVNTSYIPYKDGPVDTVLILTEDLCNIQKTVRFIGTVHDPKVDISSVTVTSNVGVAKIDTIRITNPSTSVDLFVSSITTSDTQFQFIKAIPSLSYPIPPGGFMDIIISYLPDTAVVLNAELILKGMPCDSVVVSLVGNPSLAMVDIVIDEDYTGMVGEQKDILVYLRNAKKFAESGTTTIDYDVSFDSGLLQQVVPGDIPESIIGIDRVLHLIGRPVKNHNNFQVIDTLKLLVTDGNVDSTILNIKYAVSNKKNVVFNEDDGIFRLIGASAKLYTKFYEKSPGEVFELEIWQKDAKNLSPFHGSITTEVRCNATVLEGVGHPNVVVNDERIVTLSGIPIINTSRDTMLKSFSFRPMLGPVDTTYIKLENSRSDSGKINFETVDGMLKLKVCIDADGTKRLFDPTRGSAGLEAVNPNPTSGITEIKFTLSEPGITNIWITNVFGDKILNVANDDMKPGSKTLYFDANDLPDGVYFVMMQTPTQIFKRNFAIIK